MSTIPQLAALKTRLNQLNIQKARYGISADPHIEMEASDLETIVHQMGLIETYRRNLNHLINQRSQFGGINVPVNINNQIIATRAEIAQLRQVCARLGQSVPEHPLDSDEPEQPLPPVRPAPAPQPASDLRAKLDQAIALLTEIRSSL